MGRRKRNKSGNNGGRGTGNGRGANSSSSGGSGESSSGHGAKCTTCAEHERTISRLEDQQSSMQADLQEAQTKATGAAATLFQAHEEKSALERKLSAVRSEKSDLAKQLDQQRNRVSELEARIEAAEVEADSLLQAEVIERKAALTALERQARSESDRIVKEATEQASDTLRRAEEQARRLLDEAVVDAANLRAKAHGEAAEIIDGANSQREASNAEATGKAADTLARAREEQEKIIKKGREEAAKLRGEAMRQKGEWEAESKQVLETALSDAERIRRDAEANANRVAEKIEEEAKVAMEERRAARLAEVEQELEERRALLEAREGACRLESEAAARALAEAKRTLADAEQAHSGIDARQRRCEQREADLEAELDQLASRRQALEDQEARLGAERVERLEQELGEANERLDVQRGLARERAEEIHRLQEALDAAGGEDALARTKEVRALRERVADQKAEIAKLHDDDTVQDLRREVEQLRPFRERFQQLQQERLQEEGAAATAEQRVIDLRRQLRDGERERDSLASALQLAEKERDGLRMMEQRIKNQDRDLALLTADRDHLEVVNANFKREIEAITGEVKEQAARHYGSLVRIDEQAANWNKANDAREISNPGRLNSFAEALRQRMAADGRYYDKHTVRVFLGSMAASRIILLKGISGTGKTSLPLFAAKAMGAPCLRVPVQSSWRDRTDLLGFYNAITKELNASKFTEAIYRSCTPEFSRQPSFLVLDEANLSRVEYYFADFLSELEDDTKEAHTVTLLDQAVGTRFPEFLDDGRELVIPRNTWFFLTANEDESTFEIADKTFDRASVMQLDERAKPLDPQVKDLPPVSLEGLRQSFDRAALRFSMDDPKAFLAELEGVLKKRLRIGYGNRFDKQLPAFAGTYVAAGGKPGPAMDHFVRTKILRRIEQLRDPGLKPDVEKVKEVFDIWPYDQPPETCLAIIEAVLQRLS
jgi:hypothetical protein